MNTVPVLTSHCVIYAVGTQSLNKQLNVKLTYCDMGRNNDGWY
jgi:hypothetical protein